MHKTIKILLTLIIIFLILFAVGTFSNNTEEAHGLSFLEDVSGTMEIQEVMRQSNFTMGSQQKNDVFSFGNSSSTYWIKVPLSNCEQGVEYISVYNPTVKEATLYLPTKEGILRELKSGWSAGSDKQDDGMLCPVFHLAEDTDCESFAYLRLYSDFTQNYTIDFLTGNQYNADKVVVFLLQGILFGIMFSVAIQVFLTYLQLKEKSYLYYFFYIVAFTIYQGCLSGIYNIISPVFAQNIMPFTIALSLTSINAMILFSTQFFKIEEKIKLCHKIAVGFIIANFTGALLSLFLPIITNIYAHLMSVAYVVFFMYIAFRALKQGSKSARIYIVGMAFMILSLIVSILRNSALINNNVFTLNIVSIASVLQAILILSILIKRVKTLTEEKIKMLTNYKSVEEKAYRAEVAYLRTQIEPHFLYNTLGAIISLCEIDADKASESLFDLSDFLHHTYDFDDNRTVIPLKEELEFVRAYVRIEKMRFKNKWDITYDMDDNISVLIPPLILQPLVENAIVHGTNKKKAYGHITLTVKENETHYLFEVNDDGQGMDEERIKNVLSDKHKNSVGIHNINQRLQKHYNERLQIQSKIGEGTTAYFKIPKGGTKC